MQSYLYQFDLYVMIYFHLYQAAICTIFCEWKMVMSNNQYKNNLSRLLRNLPFLNGLVGNVTLPYNPLMHDILKIAEKTEVFLGAKCFQFFFSKTLPPRLSCSCFPYVPLYRLEYIYMRSHEKVNKIVKIAHLVLLIEDKLLLSNL